MNYMAKHAAAVHGDQARDFKVLGNFPSALYRQVAEGAEIAYATDIDQLMNSRVLVNNKHLSYNMYMKYSNPLCKLSSCPSAKYKCCYCPRLLPLQFPWRRGTSSACCAGGRSCTVT